MGDITSWEAFGRLLRELRGQAGLREVASAAALGRSTLSRYERGEVAPSAASTAALDRCFGTGDRLTQVRNQLVLGEGSLPPAKPRCRYVGCFPADYGGGVWASVDRNRDAPLPEVRLRWGPWLKIIIDLEERARPHDRAVVLFTKAADGESVPVFVTTSTAAIVSFGIGDVDGEGLDAVLIDANDGWIHMT